MPKDVLYVIAIVLAVLTRGLYTFTYYKDNVITTYYRQAKIIYIKNCHRYSQKTEWSVLYVIGVLRYPTGNDRCNDFERTVVKTGQCFRRCFTRYHFLLRKRVFSRIFVKVFCVIS